MTNTNELTAKLKAAAQELDGETWHYARPSIYGSGYIINGAGQTVVCTSDGDVPAKCAGFIELANPANILALTEELDDAEKRIAELEARTLTVKLPAHKYRECVNGLLEEAIAYAGTQQLRERLSSRLANFVQPDHPHARCAAAGIKLQIEGE